MEDHPTLRHVDLAYNEIAFPDACHLASGLQKTESLQRRLRDSPRRGIETGGFTIAHGLGGQRVLGVLLPLSVPHLVPPLL